jgi:hypothetical protein
MLFASSDFTAVNRAALFAARVALGAAVSSSDGGIWGVSDPLCHPPFFAPWSSWRGRSRPESHVTFVRTNRARPWPLSSAPA